MSCGCETKADSPQGTDIFCKKCFWTWLAIGVVAFITLYHYHDSSGRVHLG